MPTIAILLKVRDTDEKPRIFKIIKGAFGSSNRISLQLKNNDNPTTAYNLSGKTVKVYLYNFENIVQREFNASITNSPGSDGLAHYDPLTNDFGTDDLLYLRAEIKAADGTKELTERVLFEIV